ncbi:MAG: hypothetical protein GY941_29240 [Planctomycetes bacterium]|nr:hypothetical protein [Planctomycetota bacterium]
MKKGSIIKRSTKPDKNWRLEMESGRTNHVCTDETYRIHGFNPDDLKQGSADHIERSIECYNEQNRKTIMDAFQKCVSDGHGYDMEFYSNKSRGLRKKQSIAKPGDLPVQNLIRI